MAPRKNIKYSGTGQKHSTMRKRAKARVARRKRRGKSRVPAWLREQGG